MNKTIQFDDYFQMSRWIHEIEGKIMGDLLKNFCSLDSLDGKGDNELNLLKMRNEMDARLQVYELSEAEKKSLGCLAQMKGLIVYGSVDSIENGEQKAFLE
jgi:hypothetical protein